MRTYLKQISLVVLFLFPAPLEAATIVNVNCPGSSLQSAINAASVDTQINISGTCNENILIDNDKVKLYLVGSSGTINGTSSGPALDIRGKAILITGLVITGGTDGIRVQRSANAVISGNTIQSTGNFGVVVSQGAFAVITSNTVQNNPSYGISVHTGSVAHIGFNQTSGGKAPNTIQLNGEGGISVNRSSSARIVGNDISNNGTYGVSVSRASYADIADNDINANGLSGIVVTENSAVQLGEDSGIFAPANRTTSNNLENGIRCRLGGSLDGLIGTLNGALAQTDISANCPNSLSP
jgi:parallel beta-helix repeat protein